MDRHNKKSIKTRIKKKLPAPLAALKSVNYEIPSENEELKNILSMMEKLLHWAAIVESSDDAIISKSIDGYITSWNKGAQRLYGYTPEEVIGQPVSVLMPHEKEDDFPFIMTQLQAGKKVEHYETKRKTKDGRVLDVSITVSPIRDSQGRIIGASKIARDISQRIEQEKRRDEFVNTASHELKTPITSQKVFGQLLENLIVKNGDTKYLSYIQKINTQTEKLEKLIRDLLELSRVQSGRFLMDKKEFYIDSIVEEITDEMRKITGHKIIIDGKTKAKVRGDPDRIGQVLTNLFTNAIKYSPNAERINVISRVNGTAVIIGIQDFGIGIEEQYHMKIFERFFRVAGENEKTFPGMGIGLDFSREIVQRHGGKIWVESEKGQGSVFYFSLPYIS